MEGLIVEARSFNEEEARAAELQLPAAGAPVPAAVMRSKVRQPACCIRNRILLPLSASPGSRRCVFRVCLLVFRACLLNFRACPACPPPQGRAAGPAVC